MESVLSQASHARELAQLREAWGPLTRRTIRVLLRAGVPPERLPAMNDRQLRRIHGLGPAKLREIRRLHPAPGTAADAPASERGRGA